MKAGTWKHYRIPPSSEKKQRSKKRKEPEPDSRPIEASQPMSSEEEHLEPIGTPETKGNPNDAYSKTRWETSVELGLLVSLKRFKFYVRRIRFLNYRKICRFANWTRDGHQNGQGRTL